MMKSEVLPYTALILAGGRGARMGGHDKGWVRWHGKPLIEHALICVKQQTLSPAEIIISANRNLETYALTGARVVSDVREGYEGPLAGIEAGLLYAQSDWVLVTPCDMPNLPLNLVEQLRCGLGSSLAAVVSTKAGLHPLCLLLHRSILKSVSARLNSNQFSVKPWVRGIDTVVVMFDDSVHQFENVNALNQKNGDLTEKNL